MKENFVPMPRRIRVLTAVVSSVLLVLLALSIPTFPAQPHVYAVATATPNLTVTPTPMPNVSATFSLTGDAAATETDIRNAIRSMIQNHYTLIRLDTDSAGSRTYVAPLATNADPIKHMFIDEINKTEFDYENAMQSGFWAVVDGYFDGPTGTYVLYIGLTWKESAAQQAAVKAAAQAYVNGGSYPKTGTDTEKLTAINNYVCGLITYDAYSASDPQNKSPWTAICDISASDYHRGTCTVYSLYGMLVLKAAGYTVMVVESRYDYSYATMTSPKATSDGFTGAHAWVLVQVGGKWYHIDFTWDDAGSVPDKDYFLKTDDQMKVDHSVWYELRFPTSGTAYYPTATSIWPTPTPSPKPTPTTKPPTPTPKPATPTPTGGPTPTAAPTATGGPTPTVDPNATPSPEITGDVTPEITGDLTPSPEATPSPDVTAEPSGQPTGDPTGGPTPLPTATPTPGGSGLNRILQGIGTSLATFGQNAYALGVRTYEDAQRAWNANPTAGLAIAAGAALLLVIIVVWIAVSAARRKRSRK